MTTDQQPPTDAVMWKRAATSWRTRAERAEAERDALRTAVRSVLPQAHTADRWVWERLRVALDTTAEAEPLEGMIRRRLADSAPLTPESARAIEDMLRQAYAALDSTSEADR